MNLTTLNCESLHSTYSLLSRMDIKFTTHHRFAWERWAFDGYTAQDLELVIKYLWRNQKPRGAFTPAAFRFQSLIEDLPRFADNLALARAEARAPKHDDRASVLEATGRPGRPQKPARSIGDVIAGEKAFEDFKRLKEIL